MERKKLNRVSKRLVTKRSLLAGRSKIVTNKTQRESTLNMEEYANNQELVEKKGSRLYVVGTTSNFRLI